MLPTASIVAQTVVIGAVQSDPSTIRGDGGGVAPTLVVPLTVELQPKPAEQAVAVTALWATAELPGQRPTPLGELQRVLAATQPGVLWRSHPQTMGSYQAELRLTLTPLQVRALEAAPRQGDAVALTVHSHVEAAWVRQEDTRPFGSGAGSAVELLPLTWIRTDELNLSVPRAHWAEHVLPGLGGDRYRTVLLDLPDADPLGSGERLVNWFDNARQRYDAGDWRGCI